MRGNSGFTDNIKLSIWEYFDKFKMKDFNEDNLSIDKSFELLYTNMKEYLKNIAPEIDVFWLKYSTEVREEYRYNFWRMFNGERLPKNKDFLLDKFSRARPDEHIERIKDVYFSRIDKRNLFEGNSWINDRGFFLGGRPGDYNMGLTIHPIEVIGEDKKGSKKSKYDVFSIVYIGDKDNDVKRLHYFNSFMLNMYFDMHNDNYENDKENKYGGRFVLTVSVGAYHEKPFKNKWYKPVEIYKLGWGD